MNAKNSLCMNRKIILPALSLMLLSTGLNAQTFDVIERRDFWNAGRNVNGIRTDSVTVSYAELYGNYTCGRNRDISDPATEWTAGASAATITHLEKFSMTGKFSFMNVEGKNACGSMSSRPGYYPVDIYEFTPGRKTRQVYSFTGGISVDLGDSWRIGGKMDFESQNYTKRKDLRHTDYLLDMTVVPSLLWHRGDIAAGVSGIFSKNSETITAEELGITSGVYYAFLDKGMMYGTYDIWDNAGLHIKESGVNGFPSREISCGGALQVQWRNLYAEAEFLDSDGSSGEKQKIWYNFGGWSAGLKAGWKLQGAGGDHYFRGRYSFRSQDNDENVLEDVTENGVTITHNYGSNRILSRQSGSAELEWEMICGNGNQFCAGADWDQERNVSSVMYPYVMGRRLDVFRFYVGFMFRFGRFDWKLRVDSRRGWNDEDSRKSREDTGVSGEPYRLEDYYARTLDYRTAKMAGSSMSLRYNFRKGIYIEPGFNCLERVNSGKSIFRLNKSRFAGSLKLGYDF